MLDPDLYILKGRYPVPVQVLKNKNKNFIRCYFLSLSCVKNFRSEEKIFFYTFESLNCEPQICLRFCNIPSIFFLYRDIIFFLWLPVANWLNF